MTCLVYFKLKFLTIMFFINRLNKFHLNIFNNHTEDLTKTVLLNHPCIYNQNCILSKSIEHGFICIKYSNNYFSIFYLIYKQIQNKLSESLC